MTAQVIYADTLFALNFAMNFLSLFLCGCLLHMRRSFLPLSLSAALGGALAVAEVLLGATALVQCLLSIPQAFLLVSLGYRKTGTARRYLSLVLLFFLIAFLTGMMSIAVYVVKSQMLSKYSNSDEVSMMQLVYPMLISLNVVMQSVFAYIVFCVTTARRLGTWFLPTAGILMAIPIVMLIIASMRRRTESKSVIKQYKLMEKSQKDAIAYRTAVDWWIGILLGGSVVFLMYLLIAERQ